MGRRRTTPVVTEGDLWNSLTTLYGVAGSYGYAIEDLFTRLDLAELTTHKNMEFYRAESLGTDTTDGAGTVTHGQGGADYPFNTSCVTDNILDSDVGSFSDIEVARLNRRPVDGVGGTLVIECRTSIFDITTFALFMGLHSGVAAAEVAAPGAVIFYSSAIGPNFQARSYDVAEEQTDTGVAADTEWHSFRIVITAAEVNFYIDGTLVATHTAQIPEGGLVNNTNKLSLIGRTLAAAARGFRYGYAAIWNE